MCHADGRAAHIEEMMVCHDGPRRPGRPVQPARAARRTRRRVPGCRWTPQTAHLCHRRATGHSGTCPCRSHAVMSDRPQTACATTRRAQSAADCPSNIQQRGRAPSAGRQRRAHSRDVRQELEGERFVNSDPEQEDLFGTTRTVVALVSMLCSVHICTVLSLASPHRRRECSNMSQLHSCDMICVKRLSESD